MRNFFLIALLLLATIACFSQDYIITWKDDTISCTLPGHPAKADLKPRYKYQNGYIRIAALLSGDSIRIFLPHEIKGYYRKNHGKHLLCDGSFSSVKTTLAGIVQTDAEGKKNEDWYFLLLVQKGEYASLYKRFHWGSRLYTYYYVVKHDRQTEPTGYLLSTKKACVAALGDKDIGREMLAFIRGNKKYTEMVAEYNRLKKAATLLKEKEAG